MTPGATSSGLGAARGMDALPRTFGRYVLFDHIGRGGMADIYLARMRTSLGGARNVVVKEILPTLGDHASFRQMLTAEAKLAAKLNHANIVQVFDFGEQGDRLFIAMDYVEGFDLAQLLKRLSKARVPLPAEFAIFIVREALRGLDYAHRAKDESGAPLGIVHRDVSPSNVLISFEGEVKLCDFGIARAMRAERSDESAMRKTRVAGKSAYMAPEHARGEDIDERADLYAAGILLWELCAGRRLHKGTEDEMLAAARAGVVPPLPPRGLPNQDTLQAILDRALAMDRDARFPNCAEFLGALEEWALGAKLMASPLRFGSFLTERFADEIVSLRRERERLAVAEVQDGADPSTFGPSSVPPPMDGPATEKMPGLLGAPEGAPTEKLPRVPPPLETAAAEKMLGLAPPLEGQATDEIPSPPQLPLDLLPPPGELRDEVELEPGPEIPPPPAAAPRVSSVLRGGPAQISPPNPRAAGKPAFVVRPPSAFEKRPAPERPPEGEETLPEGVELAPSSPSALEREGDQRFSSAPPTVVAKATPAAGVATPPAAPAPPAEPPAPAPLTSHGSPSAASASRPLGAPPPKSRAARRPPSALTPFTPTWYGVVLAGAVAFGFLVYFVLSP